MKVNSLEFVEFTDDGYKVYKCPLCGGIIKVHDSVFYGRCDSCLATLIDYKPAPHQKDFHKSKAKFRLNIGGYGSGKTTMDAFEICVQHALNVPNGRTLITAQTVQQVKEAVLPEVDKFLPPWFIVKQTKTPQPKYTLTNGHEIIVYASDDEEKLRSLNLSAFWIVEASGVSFNIFTQLQSRLRNRAAVVKDREGKEVAHNFMGIVESNPDDGWIRDEFLLRSSKIFASKHVDIEGYKHLKAKKPEESYHSFLSSTRDNTFLHETFIKDLCVGKSPKWIRKFIDCYLEVKEGAVYPELSDALIDPFPIPDNWLRIFGFDKGYMDETCLCCGAIDTVKGICYIYDEYYENQRPITYHAHRIKEKTFQFRMYKGIQADPTVKCKNDRDGVSYQQYFFNVSGLWLEEANNDILNGIEKVRDMMYRGTLKVFTNCVNLKDEAQKYLWQKGKDGIMKDAPTTTHNHLMDAMRYMCMALPYDLRDCDVSKSQPIKSSILDRLSINNNSLDAFNDDGVYGMGYYNM